MRYRAIRDSYGFMGRYWNTGEIVDVSGKEQPGAHFERVDEAAPEEKVEEEAEAPEAPALEPDIPAERPAAHKPKPKPATHGRHR